jgi:hypothetical protein
MHLHMHAELVTAVSWYAIRGSCMALLPPPPLLLLLWVSLPP